eukprot:TRINITY_DN27780_c0_g1_i1.p1 TRINITY_DN27780_c0_g1~~TRINITY_DN27780_c0_g1_i1.p1  ORF type:complete len:329 (+),score=39.22 TRINITY_DN27780_c0_g1_i1:71-988(+)
MVRSKRLQHELRAGVSTLSEGTFAKPVDDDLRLWKCVLVGMPGSLYDEGHALLLYITVGNQYPSEPDIEIKCLSTLHHPLMHADGSFDLGILQAHVWSPVWTFHKILVALQFAVLNPTHPDILVEGCFPNEDWMQDFTNASRRTVTPQQHRAELFGLLLDAVQWKHSSFQTVDFGGARFLRALRFFLEEGDIQQRINWQLWFSFCKWLSHAYFHCEVGMCAEDAPMKVLWEFEAKTFLDQWWHGLTGVRELSRLWVLDKSMGSLVRLRSFPSLLNKIFRYAALFPEAWLDKDVMDMSTELTTRAH